MGRKKKETLQVSPGSQRVGRPTDTKESPPPTAAELDVAKSIMCHKKFRKFNNVTVTGEELSPAEINGSDSETGSGLEIKVLDPNASSESTCSTPLHDSASQDSTFSDLAPRFLKTFSKSISRNKLKVKCKMQVMSADPELICDSFSTQIDLASIDNETQLPDPVLNIVRNADPRRLRDSDFSVLDNLYGDDSDQSLSSFKFDETAENQVDLNTEGYADADGEEIVTYVDIIDTNTQDAASYCVDIFNECVNVEPKKDCVKENEFSALNLPTSSGTCITNDDFSEFQEKLSLSLSQNCKMSRDSSLSSLDSNSCDAIKTPREISPSKSNKSKSKDKTPPKHRKPAKTKSNTSPKKINNVENETNAEMSTDSSNSSASSIRRSSRIKTISVMKQRSKGHGLVKDPRTKNENSINLISSENNSKESNKSGEGSTCSGTSASNTRISDFPLPNAESELRPVKVKSRWRRSSEMEMGSQSPITPPSNSPNINIVSTKQNVGNEISLSNDSNKNNVDKTIVNCISDTSDSSDFIAKRLSQFEIIYENIYHCDKTISKEARKMTCDCFLTKEEIARGELGCGEDCLNRLLMIECNSRCPVGSRCTNRRFQSLKYSELKVVKTEKKGLGIQAVNEIPGGEFLMEYVGEVLNSKQFHKRAGEYSSDKNTHHYFMALKGDAVIDATLKGNVSRFINHSCDPNSETQKWTVNGELRIGFFSKRNIKPGEEITFDYQFQRYGKEAQKCYCEASNCRGWIGDEPGDSESEDEEEEEEEESEEEKEVPTEVPVKEVIENKNAAEEIKKNVTVKKEANKTIQNEKPKKRGRPKKATRNVKELLQDVDLKEDMESLKRSGIKNQSHTLSLCRAMVRAKWIDARKTVLDLLANADLPCRRLFLDYRGLKLLAPWCDDADGDFRISLLRVLEKLPIPNKTIIHECKLISYIEKWLNDFSSKQPNSYNDDSSDNSRAGTPLIDESNTSIKNELKKDGPAKINHDAIYRSQEQKEKVIKNCKHLLERWSKLKEEFKIPKKERIQLMKEHEREANETRIKSEYEKKHSRESERWEERYSRHDRDNKKRIRAISPDANRRSQIRLDDRVLSSIPPMSKEARRREFAARVALEEQMKHNSMIRSPIVQPGTVVVPHGQWVLPQPYVQGVPHPNYSGILINPIPTVNHTDYAIPTYQEVLPSTTGAFVSPYYPQQQPIYPMHPIIETANKPIQYVNLQTTNMHFDSSSVVPQHYQNTPIPANGSYAVSSSPNSQRAPYLSTPNDNTTYSPYLSNAPQPIPTITPAVPMAYPQQTYDENVNKNLYYNTINISEEYSQPLPVEAELKIKPHEIVPSDSKQDKTIEKETETQKDQVIQLPSKWRSNVDERGRTYFYHVQDRVPQWEPPIQSPINVNDESGDEEISDDEKNEMSDDFAPTKLVEGVDGIYQVIKENKSPLNGLKKNRPGSYYRNRKHRPKLVTEWFISPRTEEDRAANKIELKRYKDNKEKMRRRREQAMLAGTSNHKKDRYNMESSKPDEISRRIKDVFLSNMARVIVHHLNPYRRDDCLVGHITNNADFKHLARKLNHFVMLKELKHCKEISELQCNSSVKLKAKEFIKKYMMKFGPVYQRPPEEMD